MNLPKFMNRNNVFLVSRKNIMNMFWNGKMKKVRISRHIITMELYSKSKNVICVLYKIDIILKHICRGITGTYYIIYLKLITNFDFKYNIILVLAFRIYNSYSFFALVIQHYNMIYYQYINFLIIVAKTIRFH